MEACREAALMFALPNQMHAAVVPFIAQGMIRGKRLLNDHHTDPIRGLIINGSWGGSHRFV